MDSALLNFNIKVRFWIMKSSTCIGNFSQNHNWVYCLHAWFSCIQLVGQVAFIWLDLTWKEKW